MKIALFDKLLLTGLIVLKEVDVVISTDMNALPILVYLPCGELISAIWIGYFAPAEYDITVLGNLTLSVPKTERFQRWSVFNRFHILHDV
jgi:hypothetical protein